MAPPEPRLQVIRERADQRVDARVDDQRQGDDSGGLQHVHVQDLIVVEQQEGAEDPVLQRFGQRADGLVDLGGQADLADPHPLAPIQPFRNAQPALLRPLT
jgi:hypothetical protein